MATYERIEVRVKSCSTSFPPLQSHLNLEISSILRLIWKENRFDNNDNVDYQMVNTNKFLKTTAKRILLKIQDRLRIM